MISILLTILILALVFGIFYWVVTLFPIAPPFKQIALAILALVFLLVLLNVVGLLGGPAWRLNVG